MTDKDNEQYVDVLNAESLERAIREDKEEEQIPEKFRGKRKSDIVKSYLELEQAHGRQGQELGELRQLADSYIKAQLNAATASTTGTAPTKEDGTDATSAVDPKAYAHELAKVRRLETEIAIREAHPDYQDIIKDPDFAEYIKSSKMRTRLYLEADQNFDFDAANELLQGYKDHVKKGNSAVAQTELDNQRQRAMSAGRTAAGTGAEATTKKIFRRADLIRLKQLDSERYMQMSDEIQKAYAEGRVR